MIPAVALGDVHNLGVRGQLLFAPSDRMVLAMLARLLPRRPGGTGVGEDRVEGGGELAGQLPDKVPGGQIATPRAVMSMWNSTPSRDASRHRVSSDGVCSPDSSRATAGCCMSSWRANPVWVSPCSARYATSR